MDQNLSIRAFVEKKYDTKCKKEKLDKLDFKNYALKNGEDGKFYMT